ncbi:MAG: hypothetical protein MUO26_00940 [Methanotrichaceae archaeon]|nr:hypothetical protein [Methanotrichaceae archaeon]
MIIIPTTDKLVAIQLVKSMAKIELPVAVEDTRWSYPYFVWIFSMPSDPKTECRFADALLKDAGFDPHEFTEQELITIRDKRHDYAIKDLIRGRYPVFGFVDPRTWQRSLSTCQ